MQTSSSANLMSASSHTQRYSIIKIKQSCKGEKFLRSQVTKRNVPKPTSAKAFSLRYLVERILFIPAGVVVRRPLQGRCWSLSIHLSTQSPIWAVGTLLKGISAVVWRCVLASLPAHIFTHNSRLQPGLEQRTGLGFLPSLLS